MKHKIDPTVDCVFKAVLGKDENKRLLIHFLNAILKLKGEFRITDVTIINPYNEREFERDKLSVVDVKAYNEGGTHYQIEIQRALHPGLASRILYTWSAIYHSLLKKGETYIQLEPVISIWLLKESLFPLVETYHLPFGVYNLEHEILLTNHLAIHLLQLPKWRLNKAHIDETDRWMYFFKEGKNVDVDHPPDILNTEEMRQAMKVLEQFSENENNYLLYEQRLDAERLELTWRAAIEQKTAEVEQKTAEVEQKTAEVEKERREKERLLALLKKAGIDPNQTE